ncbi:MAG: nitroreductase family deazaflavin-dependent oxidoreductase, partial [Deltaproteobacteria bacterium]|nr:nitroreductase family deazaflavin-dependent oxidoreductase [Deltaproteobacteria bacterium]
DRDPAWWLNLQAEPEAKVRVRSESWRARARLATSEERETLWPWLKEQNPPYGKYEGQTDRLIPVVLLQRVRD